MKEDEREQKRTKKIKSLEVEAEFTVIGLCRTRNNNVHYIELLSDKPTDLFASEKKKS